MFVFKSLIVQANTKFVKNGLKFNKSMSYFNCIKKIYNLVEIWSNSIIRLLLKLIDVLVYLNKLNINNYKIL